MCESGSVFGIWIWIHKAPEYVSGSTTLLLMCGIFSSSGGEIRSIHNIVRETFILIVSHENVSSLAFNYVFGNKQTLLLVS